MSQISFNVVNGQDSNALVLGFTSVGLLGSESLAIFSQPGYAPTNKLSVTKHIFNPGIPDLSAAKVTVITQAVTGLGGASGSVSNVNLNIVNQMVELTTLSEPILIKSVSPGPDGGIYPKIQGGHVWRLYKMSANEPSWSWLSRAGYTTGDLLLLGYTVPEIKYQPRTAIASGTYYNSTKNLFYTVTSKVYPLNPNTIQLPDHFAAITKISTTSTLFSGLYLPESASESFIQSYNPNLRQIKLNQSLDANIELTVEGLVYADYYTYTGYRHVPASGSAAWHHFDCNPEYGHVLFNPVAGELRPSSTSLVEECLIYAVPTSAAKIVLSNTGSGEASGSVTFNSAFNYGETHFIRHYIGPVIETFDPELNTGQFEFYNYWGVTPFGQSEYDYLGSASETGDIYSTWLPSMLPIGVISMDALDPNNLITYVDLRQRGGGLPTNFNPEPIKADQSLLEKYATYWDLGVYEGKAMQVGGSIEVTIQKDRLDLFTEEEINEAVKMHLPVGVNYIIRYI